MLLEAASADHQQQVNSYIDLGLKDTGIMPK